MDDEVICSGCGNAVCPTCGCCQAEGCEFASCPQRRREVISGELWAAGILPFQVETVKMPPRNSLTSTPVNDKVTPQ